MTLATRRESAGMEPPIQLAVPTDRPGEDEFRGLDRARDPSPRGLPTDQGVTTTSKLVALVDDDESMRESLPELLRSFGLEVEAYASAGAYLSSDAVARTGCLVLDVAMPVMSGPELQQELARRNQVIPIVFITARADERVRTTVLRHGAVAYLIKPFSENAIVEAVNAALHAA